MCPSQTKWLAEDPALLPARGPEACLLHLPIWIWPTRPPLTAMTTGKGEGERLEVTSAFKPPFNSTTQSSWRICLKATRKRAMLLQHIILAQRFVLETAAPASRPLFVGARGIGIFDRWDDQQKTLQVISTTYSVAQGNRLQPSESNRYHSS